LAIGIQFVHIIKRRGVPISHCGFSHLFLKNSGCLLDLTLLDQGRCHEQAQRMTPDKSLIRILIGNGE
jgi:hypothetical protein